MIERAREEDLRMKSTKVRIILPIKLVGSYNKIFTRIMELPFQPIGRMSLAFNVGMNQPIDFYTEHYDWNEEEPDLLIVTMEEIRLLPGYSIDAGYLDFFVASKDWQEYRN